MRRGDAYPDHVSVYDFKTTLFLTGTTAIKFYVACPKESNKEPEKSHVLKTIHST